MISRVTCSRALIYHQYLNILHTCDVDISPVCSRIHSIPIRKRRRSHLFLAPKALLPVSGTGGSSSQRHSNHPSPKPIPRSRTFDPNRLLGTAVEI